MENQSLKHCMLQQYILWLPGTIHITLHMSLYLKSCVVICVMYKKSKDLNTPINPLTSISDKESISPYIDQYNIQLTSHENKERYHLGDYWLMQYQILQTDNIRISWWTVRRISTEVLDVKGSKLSVSDSKSPKYSFSTLLNNL